MAIKRRERSLKPQEALERAKLALTPFWAGSAPLIAAVKSEQGAKLFPIDARINERPWIFLFMDPFGGGAAEILELAREWRNRYEPQRLGVLFFLEASFKFVRDKEWMARWARTEEGSFLATADIENLLAKAFLTRALPRLLLYNRGKIALDRSGQNCAQGAEIEFQKFFRSTDPGLPLFPPGGKTPPLMSDLPKWDMSLGRSGLESLGAEFSGDWLWDEDGCTTSDPDARIIFLSPGTDFGVIAQAMKRATQDDRGVIKVEAARDIFVTDREKPIAGEDLSGEPHARGSFSIDPIELKIGECSITEPGLYRLLRNLPAAHRRVVLRFPTADRHPILLHGFRFSDRLSAQGARD